MKYISPKYECNEIESNDVITVSIQGNNCTITPGVQSSMQENTTVTEVSSFFDTLVRPN